MVVFSGKKFIENLKEKGRENYSKHVDEKLSKYVVNEEEVRQEVDAAIRKIKGGFTNFSHELFEIYKDVVFTIRDLEMAYYEVSAGGKGMNGDIPLKKRNEMLKPLTKLADELKPIVMKYHKTFEKDGQELINSKSIGHTKGELATMNKVKHKYFK